MPRLPIDEMHQCPVKGCEEMIDIHRMMCFPHWKVVPPNLSAAVQRERDRGHGGVGSPNRGVSSREYRKALNACVAAVNQLMR